MHFSISRLWGIYIFVGIRTSLSAAESLCRRPQTHHAQPLPRGKAAVVSTCCTHTHTHAHDALCSALSLLIYLYRARKRRLLASRIFTFVRERKRNVYIYIYEKRYYSIRAWKALIWWKICACGVYIWIYITEEKKILIFYMRFPKKRFFFRNIFRSLSRLMRFLCGRISLAKTFTASNFLENWRTNQGIKKKRPFNPGQTVNSNLMMLQRFFGNYIP